MAWFVDVSGAKSASNQAAATTGSVTKPTTVNSGDLMVAIFVAVASGTNQDPGTISLTGGAGWTNVSNVFITGSSHNDLHVGTWWSIAGASEPASYTASWTNSAKWGYAIVRITGNANSSPLDKSAHTEATSNANEVAPALSGLAGTSDLLICAWGDSGGQNPYTPPAAMTTIANTNNGNVNSGNVMMSYLALSANSSSSETATASFPADSSSVSLAFLPATGAAVYVPPARYTTIIERKVFRKAV